MTTSSVSSSSVAAQPGPLIVHPVPAPAPPVTLVLRRAAPEDRPFALRSGPGAPSFSRWSYAALDSLGTYDRLALPPRHLAEPNPGHPPFTGGLVGYISYDAAWAYAARPRPIRPDPLDLPGQRFQRYDAIYARDECTGRGYVLHEDNSASARRGARLQEALRSPGPPLRGQLRAPLTPRVSSAHHRRRIREALALIEAGELYQVNLTYALEGYFRGHPAAALERLEPHPPPFSAYLQIDRDAHVVSASPECFLDLGASGRLAAYPIKGTRRRGADPLQDAAQAQALQADPKERAEHLMIVDLLRNDLSRVAAPGSVEVRKLAYIESFETVHHLTSTVTGRLSPSTGFAEVLAKTLPGGSITGAPKQAAIEVIDALEVEPRGLYTGTLMWIDRGGAARSSIAIRTAQVHAGELRFGVGGGIVHDSDPQREWEETQLKARALATALTG